jgi:diguanylate cyclase (GGDEF)-like protein
VISSRLRNRALGYLWVAGALLDVVTILLPDPRVTGARVVVAISALTTLWGLAMIAGLFDRWGRRYQHAAIVVVGVLITLAYIATENPYSDVRLFYVWVTPYAALFFTRRAAALHAAAGAVLTAAGLLAIGIDLDEGLAIWLTTVGLMVATGTLVSWAAALTVRVNRRLQHLADHDPLTGLPNRRLFHRRLDEALGEPTVDVAVLMIDLDSFKTVNDCHGHESGDQLLRQLVPRLAARLGRGDLLARLGGDEFAVLHRVPAGEGDGPSSDSLALRLRTAWSRPLAVAGGLYTSGSIGIAAAGGRQISATALLREADAALYRAKEIGRGSVHRYDDRLRQLAQRRFDLENALRGAITHRELWMAYQPVVLLDGRRLVGVEALCRWHSPALGPVEPGEFIPVAEDSGLIHDLGDWILGEVLSTLGRWTAEGLADDEFVVAVNVSPRQLRTGFADRLAVRVAAAGLRPEAIALELTEGVLMDGSEATVRELAALRAAGHSLLLDDFGTGWSALSYLADLPVDVVKVDRSFIVPPGTDPRRDALVEAVLRMTTALGLGGIAEGVESAEQADRLTELGCRHAQGWLFGRPQRAADLEPVLAQRRQQIALHGVPAQLTRTAQS